MCGCITFSLSLYQWVKIYFKHFIDCIPQSAQLLIHINLHVAGSFLIHIFYSVFSPKQMAFTLLQSDS